MHRLPRRLFIALPVDHESSIQSLLKVSTHLNKYKLYLKSVVPDNFHITLKFFGAVDYDKAETLIAEFLSLNHLRKVEYKIEGIGAFPSKNNPSVLWAGLKCDELSLAEILLAVEKFAEKNGFPPESRKFIPHLTLARVKKEKKLPLELIEYLNNEAGTLFCTSVFSELVLYESILKSTGAQYKKIGVINLV